MIEIITSGPVYTNSIILYDDEKNAIIIDCPLDSFKLIQKFIDEHGLKVKMILLTHSHWDHILDLAKVKRFYNCDVYAHTEDIEMIKHPENDPLKSPFPLEGVDPILPLEDNQLLEVGKHTLKVIHTPGHTPGCVCFYDEQNKVLISGDTLFQNGMGRLDLPRAEKEKMIHSLKKLATLPDETKVIPGHGPATTIANESWIYAPENTF